MLELVGRYEVQERIGEGAMADVYRAYDPGINRVLAIKVLKGEFRSNPLYAARFLREAKAAGALSHPNIVTIYDVGEVDGYPYIVMELLEGESLEVIAKRDGKLPCDVVMEIGLQLAEALRYAHDLGVVHRDIKPSNVILGRDGRSVKLVDFGIARVAEADPSRTEADSVKTQIGQVIGTPRYMSPEQALGQKLDGRSDLFSAGVVLYEMITGHKAFTGGSPAALALQITQADPEPIAAIQPDCPRGLQFIVGKLLAKRRDRRFADGGQMAEALRRELSVYQAVMTEQKGRDRLLSLQARMTLVMATITAVVLLGCAGGVLNRQYDAMKNMTLTSGANIASFVASNAALRAVENAAAPPQDRDWLPVQAFIKAAAADRNVKEMTVVDADGLVRASTRENLVGWTYRPSQGEAVVRVGKMFNVTETPDGGGFRFVRPITYAGHAFGKVDVTVSTGELRSAARLSLLLMSLMGAVTIGVVIAVTYAAGRLVAQPIRRLKSALADAAKGQGDFRISHSRKDEFGDLFDAFNLYAAAMQERLEAAEAMMRLTNDTSPNLGRPAAPTSGPFAEPDETRLALEQTRIFTLGGPEAGHADIDRTIIGATPVRTA